MLKENLLQKDESSSGLYFTFLVVFVVFVSALFVAFTLSMGNLEELQSKTWYTFLSFSISPLLIIVFVIGIFILCVSILIE